MVVTHFDKLMQKEREEGLAEGKVEEALDTAKRMLAKGKYSIDEIADVTDLPIDKVKELADSMTA